MRILFKGVGKEPEEREITDTAWRGEIAHKIVGDDNYYETVTMRALPNEDSVLQMICDEEGLLKQLPTNFYLEMPQAVQTVQQIVGDVGFVRVKKLDLEKENYDYEAIDITDDDIEVIKEIFNADRQAKLMEVYEKIYHNKNGWYFIPF